MRTISIASALLIVSTLVVAPAILAGELTASTPPGEADLDLTVEPGEDVEKFKKCYAENDEDQACVAVLEHDCHAGIYNGILGSDTWHCIR